jgi:hypothetical protein
MSEITAVFLAPDRDGLIVEIDGVRRYLIEPDADDFAQECFTDRGWRELT